MKSSALITLRRRLATRQAVVGVIGLGYVGLPLVEAFCAGGLRTYGFDVDQSKIRSLQAGRSYIRHIPAERLAQLRRGRRFVPTADFSRLGRCDALVICVPTPLTAHREPDMQYVTATAATIAHWLRPGQLIVLESTTWPGTTRELVRPRLEAGKLQLGRDFLLAYSPERENPGQADYRTVDIPKVVGGMDAASLQAACDLYGHAVRTVVPVASCEIAEATKILENCYRCINIAMINEMKIIFERMGIDIWQVIAAAKTKPFGFQAFYPGPGLGGHCIPIDPFYLSWKARQFDVTARFIELAGELNRAMPYYVIDKAMAALNERRCALRGARVLVLGLAYKKDVDDLRESPAVVLIEQLRRRGARVDYHDPYIPSTHPQRQHDLRMKSVPLSARTLSRYDLVLIATDHSGFDWPFIVRHARLILDTRNATAAVKFDRHKIRLA